MSLIERFQGLFKQLPTIGKILTGKGVSLGALTAQLADAYEERPALQVTSQIPGLPPKERWSFRDLEEMVSRFASIHRSIGHLERKRVLVAVGNRVDILLHIFSLARAGAIAVPVNPRLKPAEFEAVVTASNADSVIADGDVLSSWNESGLETISWCWSGAGPKPEHLDCEDFSALLRSAPGARLLPGNEVDAAEPALFLCTSGTTGHPKAAALTSEGLLGGVGWLMALPVGRTGGLRAGRDVVLAALPLTHVMGLSVCLASLCAGVRLIQVERFVAKEVLDLFERHRPNVFVGVPTMYADLEANDAAHRDLSSVQLWVSGADSMPPDRALRFQRYGAALKIAGQPIGLAGFADIYGMVELSGPMAIRWYSLSLTRRLNLPSFAFILPGFEARVVDESEQPLGWGESGQLQVRGAGVLKRYEGRPDSGPDQDGWFVTGDLARLWPGGIFSFAGRSRDRLKVGGFSVFPAEVEATLRTHPGVSEVALVGVPDERLGERPVALVIPLDEDFSSDDFLVWAAQEVAGYRKPRQIILVQDLPRGNHGKIDRKSATQIACQHIVLESSD